MSKKKLETQNERRYLLKDSSGRRSITVTVTMITFYIFLHLHFETRSIKTGRTIEPLTVLKKYQPKLKYKIMGGKWHYPVKAVFENYNKKGLDIIEGRV